MDGCAPALGRDRLASACPQTTDDPLSGVRHCVRRGAEESCARESADAGALDVSMLINGGSSGLANE